MYWFIYFEVAERAELGGGGLNPVKMYKNQNIELQGSKPARGCLISISIPNSSGTQCSIPILYTPTGAERKKGGRARRLRGVLYNRKAAEYFLLESGRFFLLYRE